MCIGEDNILIYLTRIYLKDNWDLELEDYFKKLFLKFKNYYDIDVAGYYNIDVYKNKNYGYIIRIIKEDFEYLDYINDQVDMRIKIHEDVPIFYEIKDINLRLLKDNLDFYFFKDKVYGKPKEILNTLILSKILEMSENVIYDENSMIESYGKKIVKVD